MIGSMAELPEYQVKSSRSLEVVLTQGALDNGYIRLPRDQQLFRSDFIANSDDQSERLFDLVLPDGEVRQTCVLGRHGRIQSRFYALFSQLDLKPGDKAVLTSDDNDSSRFYLAFIRQVPSNEAAPTFIEENNKIMTTTPPLNQILFGPPGTGKTYATINAALEIVDPEFLADHPEVPGSDWVAQSERRNVLKQRFDELSEAGLIRFVTFHQSFSYEDFVEGLRAKTENGRLQYQVEDGVFKELAERSSRGMTAEDDPFDKALAILLAKHAEADGRLTMKTKQGKQFDTEYTGGHTFLVYPHSAQDQRSGYTGNLNHVRKVYQTGSKTGIYNPSYVEGMLIYLKKECGLPESLSTPNTSKDLKNFVLIIDEINRGNISRIFGELITLIEPSKRKGSPEALELVLPYSKETFSVPDNLYLLGTMNTADRSLAGLDIALRRRFTFREMPPRPELLDGVNIGGVDIGELLRNMNARIEVLLDADHCLGHAYFMPLKENNTLDNLAFIFRQQVLPLLQEYFFEDWECIAWVLNDQRKPSDLAFVQRPSADLVSLFGNDTAGNLQDRRWRINEKAFFNIESYRRILGAMA